jgi:hypothetical protein
MHFIISVLLVAALATGVAGLRTMKALQGRVS